jgi:hypothetical protein
MRLRQSTMSAAVKAHGEYILVFRSHLRNGLSIPGIARSKDGYSFAVDADSFMIPAGEGPFAEYEESELKIRVCVKSTMILLLLTELMPVTV